MKVRFRHLRTKKEVDTMAASIIADGVPQIAFDTESSRKIHPEVLTIAVPVPLNRDGLYTETFVPSKDSNIVVYLIQLSSMTRNLPLLKRIFTSTKVLKCCADCPQDVIKLQHWFGIIFQRVVDIQTLERSWGGTEVSLNSLGLKYLEQGKVDNRERGSQWTGRLTYNQLVYACVDAYLTLGVFQAMTRVRYNESMYPLPFTPIDFANSFIVSLLTRIAIGDDEREHSLYQFLLRENALSLPFNDLFTLTLDKYVPDEWNVFPQYDIRKAIKDSLDYLNDKNLIGF